MSDAMEMEMEQLTSENIGDCLHLVLNAIPRPILVKIKGGDDEAANAAVYWLSHLELTLPAKHAGDIPGFYQIQLNKEQNVALVKTIFAILIAPEKDEQA